MIYNNKNIISRQFLLLVLMFCSAFVFAQNKVSIEGVVQSAANKAPLEGIQVEAVGEVGASVSTDENGAFIMEVPSANIKLRFSYPGYISKEVYSTAQKMKVFLYVVGESITEMDVPLAYTTKKVVNLAQASVATKVLPEEASAVNSFEELLYKTGAKVTRFSGTPGEGAKINIRGFSSVFANVKPLVVIDGLIIENFSFDQGAINGLYHNPLFNIDPRDVESITVLKDAAATAIYGARAANGVIIVNTNAVGVGETSVGVSAFFGINQKHSETMPVIMSQQNAKAYLQGQMYGSGLSTEQINQNYPYFNENSQSEFYHRYNNETDWQDQIFDMGLNTGFHVNMKGGDEIAKYYFAGGYKRNEGNVSNTVTNKYNLRLNALIDISKVVQTDANVAFSYSDGDYLEQGNAISTNPMLASQAKMPFFADHLLDANGTQLPITSDSDEMDFSNPYEVINSTEAMRSMYNFIGKINFQFTISPVLRANVLVGSDIGKVRDAVFLPNWGFGSNGDVATKQVVKQFTGKTSNIYGELNLKYNKSFDSGHNLDGIAGFRAGSMNITSVYAAARNTASDDFKNMGGTTGRQERDGYDVAWKDYAYFGGLNYNYKDKYFANASASLDASSRFGDNSQTTFGVPSVWSYSLGLAWNIANEDFFANSETVDLLKIRASIGSTANSGIGAYASSHYYNSVQYYTTAGLLRGGIPNEELHWEKNFKNNVGIDLGMFQNKVYVTADLYKNTTKDLLSYITPRVEYGYDKYWQNQGELATNGYELGVSFTPINKDFKWIIGGTIGSYKMEMTELTNEDMIIDVAGGQKIFANDMAPGLFYGYQSEGVIPTQSEADALGLTYQGQPFMAGDVKFADRNGDKIINEEDRMVIGDPTPDFYGTLTTSLQYKQLKLEAVGSFVEGNDVYNQPRRLMESMSGFENQSTAILRRWQTNGQQTDMPRAAFGDPLGNARFSDRWIEDGSYFRLSRVTLSLDISKWLKASNTASVYVSGTNLLTVTDYLGFDPEFSYNHNMTWEGVDYGKFPQYKTVMVGFKVEL